LLTYFEYKEIDKTFKNLDQTFLFGVD